MDGAPGRLRQSELHTKKGRMPWIKGALLDQLREGQLPIKGSHGQIHDPSLQTWYIKNVDCFTCKNHADIPCIYHAYTVHAMTVFTIYFPRRAPFANHGVAWIRFHTWRTSHSLEKEEYDLATPWEVWRSWKRSGGGWAWRRRHRPRRHEAMVHSHLWSIILRTHHEQMGPDEDTG